jgi:hypothetical protein
MLFLHGPSLFQEQGGSYGIIGALSVCIKHVMPGQDITLATSRISVPSRYIPGIYILLCAAWSLFIGGLDVLRFALTGTFVAWFYLRFIRPSGTEGALHMVA